MKTNVGSFDAAARFLAGCTLLFLGVHGLGWWGLLGILPILSSVTGFCVVYAICGINTAEWEAAYERRHPHPPPDFHPHH
jgi:hypothetical protein